MAKNKPKPSTWLSLARRRYPLVFFLFLYFLLALLTYRDFGISWDEYDVYSIGHALASYLWGPGWNPQDFLKSAVFADRWVCYDYFHGAMLSALNPSFSMEYFHWLNFFCASLGFIAAYELLLSFTASPAWALLGPIFLFLTPQFTGQIPMNPRDVPFGVMYLTCLAAIYFLREKEGFGKGLLLGLLFGLAEQNRMAGFTLYPILVAFSYYHFRLQEGPRPPRKARLAWALSTGSTVILVFGVSSLCLAATWPYLGSNFFRNLLGLLWDSTHYAWNSSNSILHPERDSFLFMGKLVMSSHLPWTYLPVLILVTTPLFILFFAAGSAFWVKAPLKNRIWVLMAAAFLFNLGLFIALRPAIYLGMRHFLYVLPPLACLAAMGAFEFLKDLAKSRWRQGIALLALVNAAMVVAEGVRLHPYEYVYFNELTGGLKGAYGKFEIEYMGTSAKEAVDWLTANRFQDPRKTYHVTSYQHPFQTLYYLPDNAKYEQDREKAGYMIVLPFSGRSWLQNEQLYAVTREGVPLMDIFEK